MKRTPEILDCWFESGSMPYAQWHYPFENQEKFKIVNYYKLPRINTNNIRNNSQIIRTNSHSDFPADFIAEGLDQTRGWFYTLNVLSTALFNQPAFLNVVVNGIVLAEDGKKLSKKLKNYPEPKKLFDTLGVDALRYFLYSSAPIGEDYRFSEQRVKEKFQNVILPLWNVYSFWELYSQMSNACSERSRGVRCQKLFNPKKLKSYKLQALDQWILARLHLLIKEVTRQLDKYDLTRASRPIEDFVQDLSTWYLRRSRDRIKQPTADSQQPTAILGYVLLNLSKIMAPFMPFIAEELYLSLRGVPTSWSRRRSNPVANESVYLCDWPEVDEKLIDEKLLDQMQVAREICELGHRARVEAGIKVRQPLEELRIMNHELGIINQELLDLIKDELNVKKACYCEEDPLIDSGQTPQFRGYSVDWKIIVTPRFKIALNTKITPALKQEGMARELIRQINTLRKEAKLTIKDKITLFWQTDSEELKKVFKKFKKQIEKETISQMSNVKCQMSKLDFERETVIEGEKVWIGIKK
jgi:isoleucyl-tRNA synthetase